MRIRMASSMCRPSPVHSSRGRSSRTPTSSRRGTAVGTTGLAKKHAINLPRSREAEHEVIVYCKANPTVKVIKAIGLTFDRMRKERGIVLSK